ncbi:MAG: hypothetical protein IKC02_03635 [Oscillospiraceae bacterium]|nr:hypothetical protein [Oscillospiraceae bacterium]
MKSETITQELLYRYAELQALDENKPNWAVHNRTKLDQLVRCSISFVGKNYSSQEKKILVYASAENLSWYDYDKDCDNLLDCDATAENRHRISFDRDQNNFFPNVHIAPLSNGSLLTAVYYIAQRLCLVGDVSPRKFYEMIAVANYGKFSIETERQKNHRTNKLLEKAYANRNIDYAHDKHNLNASHDFVLADMETLKPDIIIMPKTIYNTDREFIDASKGDANVISIIQINAATINRTLSRKNNQNDGEYDYEKYSDDHLPASVKIWYNHIGETKDGEKRKRGDIIGKTRENYLRLFSYIDKKILEEQLGKCLPSTAAKTAAEHKKYSLG